MAAAPLSSADDRSAAAPRKGRARRLLGGAVLAAVVAVTGLPIITARPAAAASNSVVTENQLPGNPQSEWDVTGAGDGSIQGYTTDISTNVGGTVQFKVDVENNAEFRIDIYRLGWYQGNGARKVATIPASQTTSTGQNPCMSDPTSGLVDCGNWTVSATWNVPATAVSGVYIGRLVREDTGGASHVPFVVRNDSSTSKVLFQTSDTTWQAYNRFGGNSLYTGTGPGTGGNADGRTYKVSYNRPISVRGDVPEDSLFNAEYPMIRWMERNGYDVSYFSGLDTDRRGSELLQHQVFMSTGHDEYWSGQQRANVEAARDAGVNLAFFSGNEVFWKTRYEQSIDGSATANRTLVSYKETHNYPNNPDPSSQWTGTWRDPRGSSGGSRPENSLTGTLFTVNCCTYNMTIPDQAGLTRLWRNTTVAAAGADTLGSGILGYEWDEDIDNGSRPANLIRMSRTTQDGVQRTIDSTYGSTFATDTATHSLTMYKAPSGALVFGAGTVQWSWGLDATHDRNAGPAITSVQQATMNLFSDMGVAPETPQSGLVVTGPSTDTTAPTVVISTPTAGAVVPVGTVTVTGTASDVGGAVGSVEVSTDNGVSWHPAEGWKNWTYSFPGVAGNLTILVRAVDDSFNVGTPTSVNISVGTAAPDTTPPTIVARTPAASATGVANNATVSVTFNEPMNASTVTGTTVSLLNGATAVSATVAYDAASRTAVLTPTAALASATTYTVRVRGGTSGVKDVAGNALPADSTWTFTTRTASSPDTGPGGPIAVITNSADPFSKYYAEILRAEGLNEFATIDLATLSASSLSSYKAAILGQATLTSAQVTTLTNWVQAGGDLVAMRPDGQLASLLGLTSAGGTLADRYIGVNTSVAPGAGITAETMQFHGTADRYTLSGATSVASLYSDATTATVNPAVTWRTVGSNGGHAAAFSYDLARSIVYTRQGNPAWAGQEHDGMDGLRSSDLFYDSDPDVTNWLDISKVAIPQADEQQRLLANVLGTMTNDQMPLPRLWYLPDGNKAAIVLTGDDHSAVGGTSGRFDYLSQQSAPGCDVNAWKCIRATSYVYEGTPLSNAEVAAYQAAGFEIGLHPYTGCSEPWTPTSLRDAFTTQLADLEDQLPSLIPPVTSRTHCIAWSDWVTQPKVELENGIRLDTNYYYWPDAWVQNRPGLFTGSGFPMRFADTNGSMVDVYQATTQMTDESGQSYPDTPITLMDRALGSEGYYGTFVANLHTDLPTPDDNNSTVAAAQARGVPVISAKQLLEWTDGRNASSFQNLNFSGSNLTFTMDVAAAAHGLEGMVPMTAGGGSFTALTRNGSPVATTQRVVKGVSYAVFPAAAGSYTAAYGSDVTAPIVSAVTASSDSTSATVTWTTNEPATSRVDFGTTSGALNQNAAVAGLSTAHSVTLTNLTPGATYYYRVTSADGLGNTTTAPFSPQLPNQFATSSPGMIDSTVADFTAGTGTNTVVTASGDGAVTLGSATTYDFNGTALPTGVTGGPAWTSGGSVAVSGGAATVNGSVLRSTASITPGRAVEFVATFGATPYEHIGLGTDLDSNPWALFSTSNGSSTLYARTKSPGGSTDTAIAGSWVGSPHLFRIEWGTADVKYYIDGNLVQTHNLTISSGMQAVASEYNSGGAGLAIDSLMVQAPVASGSFVSRAIDGGAARDWTTLSSDTAVPTGTSVSYETRTGATPTPDGTWSAFAALGAGGSIASPDARYIQYRATLGTTGTAIPQLNSVTLSYSGAPPVVDTTAPTILSRTPGASAINVATNTTVRVAFDEPLTPASVSGTTLTLSGPSGAVAATASYEPATNTAVLTPSAALANSSSYAVTVKGGASGMKDVAGNTLAADSTWSFTTVAPPDTTPPTITGRTPAAAATNVVLASTVTATFSEAMNASTISGTTVTLAGPSGAVAATVAYNAGTNTVTLTPSAALAGSTTYTATVKGGASGVKDVAGNPLAADSTWTFSTIDTTTPTITARTPASGASGVPVASPVTVTFSEPMNASTVSGTTLTLSGTLGPVAATVAYNAATNTATLTPSAPLNYVSSYTATVKGGASGVKDVAGNTLAADSSWSFTTALLPDTTAPTISTRSPAVGATGVAGNATVTVTFSEAMSATTINGTTVTLSGPSGAVAATVTYAAATNTATLTPTASLASSAGYTATVKSGASGVKDVAGNPLAADSTWTFTTADSVAPTITGRAPAAAATNVATSSTVTATFSEAMNASTISGTTVILTAPSGAVAATVTYDSATNTVTLTPSAALASSTTYTATVKGGASGVKDVAGNALAADSTWTFTTGDTVAPTITTRTPAAGATNVATSSTVTATFSEAMTTSTVSATTVTLTGPSGAVAATVTYNSGTNTVTLAPTATLAYSTTYTATVKGGASGVKDLAGNPLVADSTWTFTTVAQPTAQQDTTVADFSAGTNTGTAVTSSGDGAVSIGSGTFYDFNGTTMPSGVVGGPAWTTGGTVAVSGGSVAVNGSVLRTTGTYAPGQSVEFVATLGGAPYEHIGLGTDLDVNPWALFSTRSTTNTLYARTKASNGAAIDTQITGSFLGAPHRYRIDWTATDVRFYIDGVLVATNTAAISSNMQVVASEYTTGGAGISIDSMAIQSLAASGTFQSRVLDAGTVSDWTTLTADLVTPAGTTIVFETRSGATITPDGTWSAWQAVGAGGTVASANSRYLQYRVTLTTTGYPVVPVVNQVGVSYIPS